jgi:hypothetical protein
LIHTCSASIIIMMMIEETERGWTWRRGVRLFEWMRHCVSINQSMRLCTVD